MSGIVTKVGVVGAAGKMGKTLIELIQGSDALSLAAAIEQPGVPAIGKDAGELAGVGNAGVAIVDDLASVAGDIDVLIDFTIASATVANMEVCASSGTAMVIGTTGLSADEQSRLTQISDELDILKCFKDENLKLAKYFRQECTDILNNIAPCWCEILSNWVDPILNGNPNPLADILPNASYIPHDLTNKIVEWDER